MESSSGSIPETIKLVFASSNMDKIKEINLLLSGLPIEVIAKKDIGCMEEIEETGVTLTENAVLKAQFIYKKYHVHCFAEDTGLEVKALKGRPGVYTARYGDESKDPIKNMEKLLDELKDVHERSARFKTVIALILEGTIHVFEGIIVGKITHEMIGKGGFGYDPVFIPNGYKKTFAELELTIKNKISHRAKAINKLIRFLELHAIKKES